MRLFWHIIRKDLLRARWLLAGWLMLTLIPVAIGLLALGDLDHGLLLSGVFAPEVQWMWVVVKFVLAGFLTASVVHEERLVGTQLQWVLLPFSGGGLLIAKLLGLVFMLWLLPALVSLPWWLVNHFGWPEVARALLEQGVLVVPAVLFSMMLAAVTDGWLRFLTWSMILSFALVLVGYGLFAQDAGPQTRRLPSDVLTSQRILMAAVGILTSLAVIVYQYRRRRLLAPIVLIASGYLSMWAILYGWRWSIVPARTQVADVRPVGDSGVSIVWEQATAGLMLRPAWARAEDPWVRLSNRARVVGLGAGELWTGVVSSVALTWPDGSSQELGGGGGIQALQGSDRPRPVPFLVGFSAQSDQFEAWVSTPLPGDTLARIRRSGPAASVKVNGHVYRRELLGSMALGDRNRVGLGSLRLSMLASERLTPTEERMELLLTRASVPFFASRARFGLMDFPPLWQAQGYFDRARGDLPVTAVTSGGRYGTHKVDRRAVASVGGVDLVRIEQVVGAPRREARRGTNGWPAEPPDPKWLEGAKLEFWRTLPKIDLDTTFAIDELLLEGEIPEVPRRRN